MAVEHSLTIHVTLLQVRLFTVQPTVPGALPIVAAALAISNNMTAEQGLVWLKKMVSGLLERGVNVVSYAADGTATERTIQRMFEESADAYNDYIIPHPEDHGRDINLHIPLYGPRLKPIANKQDSKHALKTFRNNWCSGARTIIMGKYVVLYSQLRAIAFGGGPLMLRDVERLDRQDDNAACRTFSGHTLKWVVDNHPDWVGSAVYLFLGGEIVDAIQNRFMPLSERIVIMLRMHFFLEMWLEVLELSGYAKSKHCISHEALDILRYVIRGFLQLVVIYRDDLNGEFPLLPWLHSTEVCEHVFGICRQLIKDFTMLDFQYMIPKLYVRLREHSRSHDRDSETGKATASGYNHTYADYRGLDLAALSMFSSRDEIAKKLTPRALQEAKGLLEALGVDIDALRRQPSAFPSASTWFTTSGDDAMSETGSDSDEGVDGGDLDGDAEAWKDDPNGEDQLVCGMDEQKDADDMAACELQRHMDYFEDEFTTAREDNALNGLAYATTMISVQNTAAM